MAAQQGVRGGIALLDRFLRRGDGGDRRDPTKHNPLLALLTARLECLKRGVVLAAEYVGEASSNRISYA